MSSLPDSKMEVLDLSEEEGLDLENRKGGIRSKLKYHLDFESWDAWKVHEAKGDRHIYYISVRVTSLFNETMKQKKGPQTAKNYETVQNEGHTSLKDAFENLEMRVYEYAGVKKT